MQSGRKESLRMMAALCWIYEESAITNCTRSATPSLQDSMAGNGAGLGSEFGEAVLKDLASKSEFTQCRKLTGSTPLEAYYELRSRSVTRGRAGGRRSDIQHMPSRRGSR